MRVILAIVVTLSMGCASAGRDDKPQPVRTIVTGAGRLKGGGVRMDVSIGPPLSTPTKNAKVTASPATVVTP